MPTYAFSGVVPNQKEAVELFWSTLRRFSMVRDRLYKHGESELSAEVRDSVAEECDVDEFLVDDVFRVLKGYVSPVFDPAKQDAFWTLGRRQPRWGMPWASITVYGKDVAIELRWGGTFDDVEDPPRTVRCPITFEWRGQITDVGAALFAAKQMDLWFVVDAGIMSGALILD